MLVAIDPTFVVELLLAHVTSDRMAVATDPTFLVVGLESEKGEGVFWERGRKFLEQFNNLWDEIDQHPGI